MELKENEKRTYEKLLEMAKDTNPFEVSLRNFRIKIATKRIYTRFVEHEGSHMATKALLIKLQEKGLIKLSKSESRRTLVEII